ncbi:MAG TPA: hypothetical protein VMX16_17610 [Terriglobia bacterium]|nr:hypothetical protein [Terriglobia bacterium]
MKTVLDILGQWQPGIEVATLVAVIIYVWKTWSMVSEMKLSREEQSKPSVVCYFEHNKKVMRAYDLVIKNFGKSMASDVKLVFSPQLRGDSSQSQLSEKTFKAMAPGYEWRTFWDSFLSRDPSAPDEFIAKVTYRWGPHKKLEEYDVSFDIKSLMGVRWVGGTTIEESVEAIAKSICIEIRNALETGKS